VQFAQTAHPEAPKTVLQQNYSLELFASDDMVFTGVVQSVPQ
jgi:hypothetical protein